MNAQVLDRCYKLGDLSIEVHRIATPYQSYRLSVSAWHGDFYKGKSCDRRTFGDGKKFLSDFDAWVTKEHQAYLKQRERDASDDEVEQYIEAARQHGEEAEPAHEAGDLREYLRAMWAILTPQQRELFKYDERVLETLSSSIAGDAQQVTR